MPCANSKTCSPLLRTATRAVTSPVSALVSIRGKHLDVKAAKRIGRCPFIKTQRSKTSRHWVRRILAQARRFSVRSDRISANQQCPIFVRCGRHFKNPFVNCCGMTIASVRLVKYLTMVLVIGLALISSGCASMHPSTTPSVTFPLPDKKPLDVQQKQTDPQKQYALQNNPFGESVCIATGLVQLGSYLTGGK